jgi:hypothetical protein
MTNSHDSSSIPDDVDTAERLDGRLADAVQRLAVGHVASHASRLGTALLERRGRLLDFPIATTRRDDVGAVRREPECDCLPDPARPADDDGPLPVDSDRRVLVRDHT